jgi:pimeloyl-ACP methyl ester carboxylesterase
MAPVIPFLLFACVAQAEDRFFDSAGVQIRYTVEGKGVPVVLVHGYGINQEMNWVETGVTKALAGRYQVIALDTRGHGRSGKPHDPKQYGVAMAEDVIRLMDHLKIPKAHVAGYSLGARIVSVLLAVHPDRLRTAIIGGAGLKDERGLEAQRKLMTELADSLERGQGIGPLMTALAPVGAAPPNAEQIEAANKQFLALNDALAMAAVSRGNISMEPDEARLAANRVPVLALVGDADPRKPEAERLAQKTPRVKVVVIPGANHQDAPRHREFVEGLKAFLDAN